MLKWGFRTMKNFKVNRNQEPLGGNDLNPGKGFDDVLKAYQSMKTPFFKTVKFWFGASAVTLATVVAVVLFNKHDQMPGNTKQAFIAPPIAAADIQSTAYNVNTESDSTITYTTGSKIHVPAHAFLDKAGNVVKGNVELHYREFHKISDVFIAGIPMTYDSAGEQFHFETAGMMEIAATQNGEQLKANPSALIKVDIVSDNSEDRFNTYYLDTVDRKWKYINQKNYTANAVASATRNEKSSTLTPVKTKGGIIPSGNPKLDETRQAIVKLEKEKPVAPVKTTGGKPHFTISVDKKEFPELAAYDKLKFQVEDKTYQPEKSKILWEDIKLNRIEGTINYKITFSNSRETYNVVAQPVFEDKDYAEAKKIYDQKYAEYETALTKRKADEAKLKADMEARAKDIEAKINQEIKEQAARRAVYEARLDQTSMVFRTFTVANFGIWNCDCPSRMPQGVDVVATIKDAKTKAPISISNCYLVEKGRNAMFTYSAEGIKKFRFDPSKENMVWVVTSDIKIGVIKADEFKAAKRSGGEMVLELNVIDKKFTSTDDVRSYLEI